METARPLSTTETIPMIYCSLPARSSSVKQTHTHAQTVPGLRQEQPDNPNQGKEESLEARCKAQGPEKQVFRPVFIMRFELSALFRTFPLSFEHHGEEKPAAEFSSAASSTPYRTMAAVTTPESSPQSRVYFQTPAGTEETDTPVRKQGRVTVKYDRKELRKRLNLEEWIIDQLTDLYDCEEEAIPELEIDVDELLDMENDEDRAARVKDLLVDCYKPTEDFVVELLDKIRGMQKLSTPQKK
ncbi:Protein phosphatase 1 regulatory subunit 14B [Bagarius yarrelli]|uniref:Protein phosphatase 1 regulatory subunit 14B n=1 Tax=Bagarius yarrelli TaxID=175774 RepID=A0A556TZ68_BAGYA|nr:Protein phosphatase 1 regulatory subunit 14B [Bagarius yarrelli]